MAGPEITLKVALSRSTLDARRGVVRIHPLVMDSLCLRAWDPLELRGRRATGALVAPSEAAEGLVLMDDLTSANARVAEGEHVTVTRAPVSPAGTVELTGLPAGGRIEPEVVRLALLGKVLGAGDRVGLLPQDFTRPETGPELDRSLESLHESFGSGWQNVALTVGSTAPPGLVRVTMETRIRGPGGAGTTGSSTPLAGGTVVTAEDLPGLEAHINRLRELLDLAFNRPEVLARLGAKPHLGVLISGPPGSGKGALVAAVAGAVGAPVVRTWAPALAALEPGAAVARLKSSVLDAETHAPAVVMIEDVEAIAPHDRPEPLLSVLIELITAATRGGRVAIVCTTAHPESTSPELLRPGVLDHEFEIALPHRGERKRILEVHARGLPLAPDVLLDDIASRTPGFVAADLMALCREAALRAAQRIAKAGAPFVAQSDFDAALDVVKPSSLDGVSVEVADVSMDEVGDMESTKQELTEAVVWPLLYPHTFERLGVTPERGVLLFGPPGCGKTFIVKALVHEARASFLSVKGAELLSKWVGESERSVRELFRRARGAQPALIFFDEIDALAPVRGMGSDSGVTDRVVAALLTELDGIEDLRNVLVIGATNRPELVDTALLRPGRLDRLVYIPPPSAAARGAILTAAARRMPLEGGIDLAAIAAGCEGFSAADLEALARGAALAAIRESVNAPVITAAHFERARSGMRPSLRREQLERLERFAAERAGT
jgi:transitional endoplasmic reticulum ATPase